MTAEDWARIKEVYAALMERPAAERALFLEETCRSEPLIKAEIERILLSDTSSGFLDQPPCGSAALRALSDVTGASFTPEELVCGRFRIVRFIARGGMGEVYEAYDTALQESVALKVIRPEIAAAPRIVDQFKSEVSRARRVVSPHVCRVYDFFVHSRAGAPDVTFLTMQLLVGETLAERLQRRPLERAEALRLLEQMADGLAAAHRSGIVHRDFKPGNVMLTPGDGGELSAVITDFGLALPVVEDGPASIGGGTPAYMAPEQVEGGRITPGTDVYAFGIAAFEILVPRESEAFTSGPTSGGFAGPPRAADASASGLEPELQALIVRCLEREPSSRWANAGEILSEIRRLGRGAVERRFTRRMLAVAAAAVLCTVTAAALLVLRGNRPAIAPNSIAVLPFREPERSGAPDYFADGFTEDLIHALGRLPGLKVRARDSSYLAERGNTSIGEIGRRLGVARVVTGRIRRAEGQLVVLASLVDTETTEQLWSEQYRRTEAEAAAIREDIARGLGKFLKIDTASVEFVPPEHPIPRFEAQDLYWMGRFYFRQRTEEAVVRSVEYFQKAIDSDPNWAPSYTGLADAYCVRAEQNSASAADSLARAKASAIKAATLDPNLADAYVSLGQVSSLYDRNAAAAEAYFRRALALNPSLASAHQWYSYLLVKLRRFEDAQRHSRLALEADPLSIPAQINWAMQLFYARDWDRLIAQCEKLLEFDPKLVFSRLLIAQVLARQGHGPEALAQFDKIDNRQASYRLILRTAAEVNAVLGRRAEAYKATHDLIAQRQSGGIPASYIASAYAALGERDAAFEWLEKAYAEWDGFLSVLPVYPSFDSLRSDPRYAPLIARLGLTSGMPAGSSPIH